MPKRTPDEEDDGFIQPSKSVTYHRSEQSRIKQNPRVRQNFNNSIAFDAFIGTN